MALFVKLDTNFLWNDHMVTVSPLARLLYIGGLSYCVEHLTDGRLPKAVLRRIADVADRSPAKSAAELITAGVWENDETDWVIQGFADTQLTLAKVEQSRARARERARAVPLRADVLRDDAYTCQACGAKDRPLHVDHVIPLARGGRSVRNNLRTLCQPCNLKKGAN